MEDDWEKIAEENVVKPPVKVPIPNANKWEGEDEDDDVKDNWEDDEEEKKDEEKNDANQSTKPTKSKKTLAQKIAEKERLRQEELEAKQREREDSMTPEERIAEKLRLQKLQEEVDLETALETFGVDKSAIQSGTGIDAMYPTSKAEFNELADAISKKVAQFRNKDEFPAFLEVLVRNVCANLSSNDLKKMKTIVDSLHNEKQKLEKEKTKKGGKGKTKAKLRVEGDGGNIDDGTYGYEDCGDYDDFM